MQQQIKQKLIGAAIVAVFLAIAVPFLFVGTMRQSKIINKPAALNTAKLLTSVPTSPAILKPQNNTSSLSITPTASAAPKNNALSKDMISAAEAANKVVSYPEVKSAAPNSMSVSPSSKINDAAVSSSNSSAISNVGSEQTQTSELHSALLQKEANIVGNKAHKIAVHDRKKQHLHSAHNRRKEMKVLKADKVPPANNNNASTKLKAENIKSAKKPPVSRLHRTWSVAIGGFANLQAAQKILYVLPRTYPIVIEKYVVSQKNNKKLAKEKLVKKNNQNQYRVVIKNITSENEAQSIATKIKNLKEHNKIGE